MKEIKLSKEITREIQVLEKTNEDCPICNKKDSVYLIWLFEKDRLPIMLGAIGLTRWYSEGYGVWCDSCHALINFIGKSGELSRKYQQGKDGKHKLTYLKTDTKFVEVRFVKTK